MYIKLKENNQKLTHLEIETYYSKGGYNVWNGRTDKRGYFVSVQAVSKGNGMITRSLFNNGYRMLVQEAGRFNRNTLSKLDDKTIENARDIIERVLAETGLELAEDIDQAWNNHVNGIVA